MKEVKTKENPDQSEPEEPTPDQLRREFLKRFGCYATGTAAGLYVLMSAKTSQANGSDGTPP